jgi:hypothetical protein
MEAGMTVRPYAAVLAATLAFVGCKSAPTVPASSDPDGKDLVEGAVVAATEANGGVRLYKIVHVDDYPEPIGYEYHMIAYDPKAASYEEAAKLWTSPEKQIALAHIEVRKIHFMPRDHRVLKVEPVSQAELQPYLDRGKPNVPPAK